MRGKDDLVAGVAAGTGITPAYAGKSNPEANAWCEWQDHPRLCGEKILDWMDELVSKGSPPPMRGKEASFSRFTALTGITPAYAGKRKSSALQCVLSRDHPRLCGEKLCLSLCR